MQRDCRATAFIAAAEVQFSTACYVARQRRSWLRPTGSQRQVCCRSHCRKVSTAKQCCRGPWELHSAVLLLCPDVNGAAALKKHCCHLGRRVLTLEPCLTQLADAAYPPGAYRRVLSAESKAAHCSPSFTPRRGLYRSGTPACPLCTN